MKKNKIILILAFAVLLSPMISLAEGTVTGTATEKNPSVIKRDKAKVEELRAKLMKETAVLKEKFETRKEELKKKIEIKKGEVKARINTKSQEKVKTLLDNIYTKLYKKLNKISEIDARMTQKIAQREKAGIDVKEVKAQYDIAKAALDKATADVLASKTISSEQITTETTRGAFRTLVKTAEDSIKTAANEYKKMIPMLAKTQGEVKKVEGNTETNETN